MALVKCTTSVDQAGYRANVGDIIDTSSYLYTKFASAFSAEDVELDTLVSGAPTSAYTQTYSTAAKTVPNATVAAQSDTVGAAVASTGATAVSPYGYTEAQANAIVANVNTLKTDAAAHTTAITAINALAADVLALKKVITAIIDDGQTLGLFG